MEMAFFRGDKVSVYEMSINTNCNMQVFLNHFLFRKVLLFLNKKITNMKKQYQFKISYNQSKDFFLKVNNPNNNNEISYLLLSRTIITT